MGNDNQDAMIWIGAIVALALIGVALATLYDDHRGTVNAVIIEINRALIWGFTWISDRAAWFYDSVTRRDPAAFTAQNMMAHSTFVGEYFRWVVVAVIAVFCVIVWWRVPLSEKYQTIHTMTSLVQHNAEVYPCLYPIKRHLDRHPGGLLNEPLDEGPWRTARTPIQWIAEHNEDVRPDGKPVPLLVDQNGKPIPRHELLGPNGLALEESPLIPRGRKPRKKTAVLRIERARTLFRQQLGRPFRGYRAMPDYMLGLAAAFMAFGHADKKAAQGLLDQMSRSFQEPFDGQKFAIDITGAKALIGKYARSESLLKATACHNAWEYTFMVSLLDFARRKGVLATSQFIWLRPTNRTLWYALNQLGGREPWVEAAGIWAHMDAERELEYPLHEPWVKSAVVGLEQRLKHDGWLPAEGDRA